MKHLLLTTIAAVLVVGCGEAQQSVPSPETKPDEPVAEAVKPEPPTAKAPDISIHDAVREGNIEAIKQHIAAGTDVDAKDGIGGTLLYMAASNGYKEIVELLITNGADVNAKDDGSWTSLHSAAMHGNKEIVELLIAKGADVNAKKDDGSWTSLHSAAMTGSNEIVGLLIAAGADVNAKDAYGRTPLDCSGVIPPNSNKTEIIDLLRKHGGKTKKELEAAGK